MPDQRIIEQVVGIFGIYDVNYFVHENRRSLLVPHGSACVYVDCVDFGESTVIALRSYVLQNVDASGDRHLKVLEELNEANKRVRFGKFYFNFETDMVVLEYDLFATDLQAPELIGALDVIANLADSADDDLSTLLGSGVRWKDAWDAAEGVATEGAGSGPVVAA